MITVDDPEGLLPHVRPLLSRPLAEVGLPRPGGGILKVASLELDFRAPAPPSADEPAPLVHLHVFDCADLTAYRTQKRPSIQRWWRDRLERQEEWIIVYCPRQPDVAEAAWSAVLEELHQDFHSRQIGDRCCMLSPFLADEAAQAAVAAAKEMFPALIANAIASTFAARSSRLEGELRRLEAGEEHGEGGSGGGGGTPFGALFQTRDALGQLYEQLSLPREALQHYAELQSMDVRLGDGAADDGAADDGDIVSSRGGPVRAHVANGTLTTQELRRYLFSRTSKFLGQLQLPSEVAWHGHELVRSRQAWAAGRQGFDPRAAAFWACTACWSLVSECERVSAMLRGAEDAHGAGLPGLPDAGEEAARASAMRREELRHTAVNLIPTLNSLLYHLLGLARGLPHLLTSCVWSGRGLGGAGGFTLPLAACFPTLSTLGPFPQPSGGSSGGGSSAAAIPATVNTTAAVDRSELPFAHGSESKPAQWVREALSGVASFEQHYLEALALLARCYRVADRLRFLGLSASESAHIYWQRKDYPAALRVLEELNASSTGGWSLMSRSVNVRKALCLRQAGNLRGYVHAALALFESAEVVEESKESASLRRVLEEVVCDLAEAVQHAHPSSNSEDGEDTPLEYRVQAFLEIERLDAACADDADGTGDADGTAGEYVEGRGVAGGMLSVKAGDVVTLDAIVMSRLPGPPKAIQRILLHLSPVREQQPDEDEREEGRERDDGEEKGGEGDGAVVDVMDGSGGQSEAVAKARSQKLLFGVDGSWELQQGTNSFRIPITCTDPGLFVCSEVELCWGSTTLRVGIAERLQVGQLARYHFHRRFRAQRSPPNTSFFFF